jgi:hypothetical protein
LRQNEEKKRDKEKKNSKKKTEIDIESVSGNKLCTYIKDYVSETVAVRAVKCFHFATTLLTVTLWGLALNPRTSGQGKCSRPSQTAGIIRG